MEPTENKPHQLDGDDSVATSTSIDTRKFSDFKIIRKVGEGTFGEVYLCVLDSKPCAVKVLSKAKVLNFS